MLTKWTKYRNVNNQVISISNYSLSAVSFAEKRYNGQSYL